MEGFTPWDSVILPMWHKAHVSGCMKNGLQMEARSRVTMITVVQGWSDGGFALRSW